MEPARRCALRRAGKTNLVINFHLIINFHEAPQDRGRFRPPYPVEGLLFDLSYSFSRKMELSSDLVQSVGRLVSDPEPPFHHFALPHRKYEEGVVDIPRDGYLRYKGIDFEGPGVFDVIHECRLLSVPYRSIQPHNPVCPGFEY